MSEDTSKIAISEDTSKVAISEDTTAQPDVAEKSDSLCERLIFGGIPEIVDGGICRKDRPKCFVYFCILIGLFAVIIGFSALIIGVVNLSNGCKAVPYLPLLMFFYGILLLVKTAEIGGKNWLATSFICETDVENEGWKKHPVIKGLFLVWLIVDVLVILGFVAMFCVGIYWTSVALNATDETCSTVVIRGSFGTFFGSVAVLILFVLVLLNRYCYLSRRRHTTTGIDRADYPDSLSLWLCCSVTGGHHSSNIHQGGLFCCCGDDNHDDCCQGSCRACGDCRGCGPTPGCDPGDLKDDCGGCNCGGCDCGGCDHGGCDCRGCDCGGCEGCDCGNCDCGNCDCGNCDCGNCDCGNCDCGNCDCGNCDCGGCDCAECDLGACAACALVACDCAGSFLRAI